MLEYVAGGGIMANPKSRVLPRVFSVYVFVLIAHCVSLFIMRTTQARDIFGVNFFGHLAGLVCVIFVCFIRMEDIRRTGFAFGFKKVLSGLFKGAVFALVPIALMCAFQLLAYKISGIESMKLDFVLPNASGSPYSKAITLALYAGALIVSTLMKEFFFRGYVISCARFTYSYDDINIVQAILYSTLSLFTIIINAMFSVYGSFKEALGIVASLLIFFLVHDVLSGIKWGLISKVSGDVWIAFFDHFLYDFFAFSLLVNHDKTDYFASIIKLLCAQIVSFAMVYFYYKKEIKKSAVHKNDKVERSVRNDELEDFSSVDIKKRVEDFSGIKQTENEQKKPSVKNENEALVDVEKGDISSLIKAYNKEFIDSMGSHSNVPVDDEK